MRSLILSSFLAISFTGAAPVVMDRVAVVVGRRVVKTSDIDRDLRASQFLNRQPLDVTDAARKKVVDRLIEQELIRQEMQSGQYSEPDAAALDAFEDRLRKERFGGEDARFRSALAQYGLTRERFRDYLQWQLAVFGSSTNAFVRLCWSPTRT